MSEKNGTTSVKAGVKSNTLGDCFGKTIRSWAILIIVLSLTYVFVAVKGQRDMEFDHASVPKPPVCVPIEENNYCAPVNDPKVMAEITKQEAAGRKCGDKSVLTDIIVFQFSNDKRVEVVTFDKAFELSKSSQGWVQSFCK